MQEAVHLVYPIVKVVVRFWFIARLRFASRHPIGTVHCTGNVNEDKVEQKDAHNPTVYGRAWIEVGVR